MDPRREPQRVPAAAPIAARLGKDAPPAGSTLVVFGPDGAARRVDPRGSVGRSETAWWFHNGPFTVELVPCAAAPEIGLRLDVVIDAADPRLARQRFDLFLFSEVAGQGDVLTVPDFAARAGAALRAALEQGTLTLPPCTSLDEWNAFRGGLNELLYTRFGITVDDCLPVERGDVDYAALLRERIPQEPIIIAAPSPEPAPTGGNEDPDDGAALRRLFLELPAVSAAWRAAPAPVFATRQAHLQRLALAALDVNTMPALAWSAPRIRRPADEQRRLAAGSAAAACALDGLWALLARMKEAGADDEEADRVIANLEFHLAARRGLRLAEAAP